MGLPVSLGLHNLGLPVFLVIPSWDYLIISISGPERPSVRNYVFFTRANGNCEGCVCHLRARFGNSFGLVGVFGRTTPGPQSP
jgi:hypothetical protein